jgi:hypothetical protein
MTDIGRFGQQGVVVPQYYKVREFWPMPAMWQVRIYRIDEHGQASACGHGTLAEDEQIEDLPTLEEAIAEHMKPALAEAESNSKRWLESRPSPEEQAPEPESMDRATERFLSDNQW